MTQKEFSKYRFSIKTEVEFEGEWYRIIEVNFEGYLVIDDGTCLPISEIRNIREGE